MRLVNAKYGLDIAFQEGVPEILVIENPQILRECIAELSVQCAGEEGCFVLSENRILKLEKHMELIINPFSLDFQSRKITSALFSKMAIIGNEQILEKNEINSKLVSILDSITNSVNYSAITYQLDFSWTDLFKMYGVKIEAQGDFMVQIVEYMKALSELCGISIFCFINLKNYLSRDELLHLYREATYNKISLFLIEAYESENNNLEHTVIIDKDCCLIEK